VDVDLIHDEIFFSVDFKADHISRRLVGGGKDDTKAAETYAFDDCVAHELNA
jgi:hypothetical protein